LNEFAAANPAADVCDLTKQHLDLFVESHATLSPKSRNHYGLFAAQTKPDVLRGLITAKCPDCR
jgi:hypothetical protein